MIIDTHVHLGTDEKAMPSFPRFKVGQTPEELIDNMDRAPRRVDKSCVFYGPTRVASFDMIAANDYIKKCVERFPDRLIGAGYVNPRWGSTALKELDRVVKDLGFKAIKLRATTERIRVNCQAYEKVMEHIRRLKVPAMFHSDWTSFSNPLMIGDLVSSFSDVPVVLQHMGEYLSNDAIRVARSLPNVYLETSALLHNKMITRAIEEVGADRVLFGSDAPGLRPTPTWELEKILMLRLPPEVEDKILGANAARLFGV